MSTNKDQTINPKSVTAAAADGNPNPTPEPVPGPLTAHTVAAQELLVELANIETRIPFFENPGADVKRQPLAQRRRLSPSFVIAGATAIESAPELRNSATLTPDEIREGLDFELAYEPVVARLEALAAGARYTITLKRARVGEEALQAYKAAQAMTRFNRAAPLAAHVLRMKEALGIKRRRSAAKVAKPAPATPSTPSTPTPVPTTKPA